MQKLLDMCSSYAKEHLLTCNGSKSYSLCFKPKHIKFHSPCFYLNRFEIPRVNQCKYLGITISKKPVILILKDKCESFMQTLNILSRKFSKCSPDVKCTTMFYIV